MVLMEAISPSYEGGLEGLGEELGFIARSFLATVDAARSSAEVDRDKLLGLALVDLEVLLSDVSPYRRVSDAIKVIGEPGDVSLELLLREVGFEALLRALESSVRALLGLGSLDYEAVERVARVSGWRTNPYSLYEELAASATILSIVAAFHKSASSSITS